MKENYYKAYTELSEILKHLSEGELNKIPKTIITNVDKYKDKKYEFHYDPTKQPLEQSLMVETKAMIVELYIRYLASEDEKEMWEKYDQHCLQLCKKKRLEQYQRLRDDEE